MFRGTHFMKTNGPQEGQMATTDQPVDPTQEVQAAEFLKNVPTWEEQLVELRAAFPGLTDEQIEALIP